jgi:hypothetical protein
MPKHIALMVSALMLAAGAAGVASAADARTATHVAHPRSQASLQCSAQANAKGLHGKARIAFRRDCLRKAAAYHKKAHRAAAQHTPGKAARKT